MLRFHFKGLLIEDGDTVVSLKKDKFSLYKFPNIVGKERNTYGMMFFNQLEKNKI